MGILFMNKNNKNCGMQEKGIMHNSVQIYDICWQSNGLHAVFGVDYNKRYYAFYGLCCMHSMFKQKTIYKRWAKNQYGMYDVSKMAW